MNNQQKMELLKVRLHRLTASGKQNYGVCRKLTRQISIMEQNIKKEKGE